MASCINLLRVLNKLTKWKHSRIMVSDENNLQERLELAGEENFLGKLIFIHENIFLLFFGHHFMPIAIDNILSNMSVWAIV